MSSKSEQMALSIVENLKSHKTTTWMSYYTTMIVGNSYTSRVNRILKEWKVFIPTHTGNYTVNYDAPVFH